jgi:hypothetical protein
MAMNPMLRLASSLFFSTLHWETAADMPAVADCASVSPSSGVL